MANDVEIRLLEELHRSQAFYLYKKLLQEHFDYNYKKLRKCRKADSTYDRINGILDGLEYSMKVVEEEIKEYHASLSNSEKGE